jgi:hypothetical protein
MVETRWTKLDALKWDAALREVGEDIVRVRLANHMAVVDDGWVNPPPAFTREWLASQERRRARGNWGQFRVWALFSIGIVAAIGAIIVAWPIVFPPQTH